eukprot:Lankesteria_metandrocarpae@DN3933_c0_g1_i1.p1
MSINSLAGLPPAPSGTGQRACGGGRSRKGGFTEAELAAADWSRRQKRKTKNRKASVSPSSRSAVDAVRHDSRGRKRRTRKVKPRRHAHASSCCTSTDSSSTSSSSTSSSRSVSCRLESRGDTLGRRFDVKKGVMRSRCHSLERTNLGTILPRDGDYNVCTGGTTRTTRHDSISKVKKYRRHRNGDIRGAGKVEDPRLCGGVLSKGYRRSSSTSVHSSVNGDEDHAAPKDPSNPLQAAYDVQAYIAERKGESRRKRSRHARGNRNDEKDDDEHKDRQHPRNDRRYSEERDAGWTHDRYLNRSPSPNRDRTDGSMWDTRLGSWRARAGGVFLPPKEVVDEIEERSNVARYKDANFFIRPDKVHRQRNTSQEPIVVKGRDSPVYELSD